MDLKNLVVPLAAAGLVACAQTEGSKRPPYVPPLADTAKGYDPKLRGKPAVCEVNVYDLEDQIVVDHEPVRAEFCEDASHKRWIFWRLDSSQPDYTFGSVDYKYPGPPHTECRPHGSSGQVYRCKFDGENNQTVRYYNITVLKKGQPWRSIDPTMIN